MRFQSAKSDRCERTNNKPNDSHSANQKAILIDGRNVYLSLVSQTLYPSSTISHNDLVRKLMLVNVGRYWSGPHVTCTVNSS